MEKKNTVFSFLLILLLSSQQVFSADGSIQGKVSDATTGEVLVGANVFIVGTSLGAATDFEGFYRILNLSPGTHTLKISYIGYEPKTETIQIGDGRVLEFDIQLRAVTVSTEDVIVTAQAQGQNAAINQQLSSQNIVNVVSSSRIQELPDANAAESIGRLPGISLIRSGGQATKVVIRGISPEYSQITMNGVPIPSNEGGSEFGGGRGIDMRMISSSSLDGIEVFKTNTPNMDAAVLGGTVNLGIRKARKSVSGESVFPGYMPAMSLQGTRWIQRSYK
ncbi:MAG: carboxypeptidase-like regulatory domain-containing protein [Ignavibacteriales bacterium]|nr:carboxypeptidase-like regulatory domain-containing protein [Ignavibacteriales bacterium]